MQCITASTIIIKTINIVITIVNSIGVVNGRTSIIHGTCIVGCNIIITIYVNITITITAIVITSICAVIIIAESNLTIFFSIRIWKQEVYSCII